jgi:hypothetical protein
MKAVREALAKMKLPDTSASDKAVADQNKKLVSKTFKVILGGAAIALVLAVAFWFFVVRRPWRLFGIDIVAKSGLLLIVVAITEFAYFTLITKNYHSIDPSQAKKTIVDAMAAEIKKRQKAAPPAKTVEPYNPVTMPLQDWQNFNNTLYLSGGVRASATEQVAGGLTGAVIGGHVFQNAETAGQMYRN